MNTLGVLHLLACVAGMGMAALCLLGRRFGSGSWLVAAYLIPSGLSAGALAMAEPAGPLTAETALKAAFALLMLSAPGGLIASYAVECRESLAAIRRRWITIAASVAAAAVAAFLVARAPVIRPDVLDASQDLIVIGPLGYGAALCLLVVSVMALANLEQTLRSANEQLRWEVKFLAIGLGAPLASAVYVSATVLLYPPRFAHIPLGSLRLYAVVFLISCGLILISWRRSSGRGRIAVSHGLVYSSITLLGVGVYLIVSSLLARWASQWAEPGFPLEPFVLILSILVLAAVLLATEFRHKSRRWIRRHILGGHYDYRDFWLEAAEKIRSTDPPEAVAAALAELVQRALGAIDISVWLRLRDPNRLELLTAIGSISGSLEHQATGIAEKLVDVSGPQSVSEEKPEIAGLDIDPAFLRQTNASLLVPLVSGGRLVGALTVGRDRSGKPYGWEAQEFLNVLASHAAGELHKTELLSSILQAKEAEAFKKFATFLLHDLKNFASSLSMISSNALRHQANANFQHQSFTSVNLIAEKMKRLCNSLGTFSGTLAADKSSHDLNALISSLAQSLDAGMSRHLMLELGELPRVVINAEEISRVVMNLVLNAREATSPDTGWIRMRTARRDRFAELTIEDNGSGITPEFMEKEVFKPFSTTKSEGLGIGLFQCKKIVEAHGGTIEVSSKVGKGTTVRVLLPLA